MIENIINSLNLIIAQTQYNSGTLFAIVLLLWSVFLVTSIDKNLILYFGLIPRKIRGIPGIFLAPFLHASFNHIFFNTIPLIVLSNFILLQGLPYYLLVTFLITVLSGFAVWCFGKPGIHIGASGVITGYWGFLVINAYQQGGLLNVILGVVSVYYFAGIFLGIFPQKKGVSWEAHLFGLLAGLLTSYLLSPQFYN